MKKVSRYFVIILAILLICSINVNAAKIDGYTYKEINVYGKYSDTNDKNSHKRIIRTYKDLVKLKKYIKKNYNNSKKYIKKLNKYKKSYFKKKTLIFVTENNNLNATSYRILSITKKKNNIVLNVEKKSLIKEGEMAIDMVVYGANTYIIEIKKSKLKKVKKVKVKYSFVKNSE